MNKIENIIRDSKNEIFDIQYQFRLGVISSESMEEQITKEIKKCANHILGIMDGLPIDCKNCGIPLRFQWMDCDSCEKVQSYIKQKITNLKKEIE